MFQASSIAERVAQRTGALVLPVMPFGVSGHHKDFPGTVFLEGSTFRKVIGEILAYLNRYGVRKVVFINRHGGNLQALTEAAYEARQRYGMFCAIVQWWDVLANRPVFGQPAETHGGYAETALMLASKPEAVKIEYAVLSPTKQVDRDIQLISLNLARFKDGIVRIPLRTADVSDTGSMAEHHPDEVPGTRDYSLITREFGERLMGEVVDWISDFIKKFDALEIPSTSVSGEAVSGAIKR